MRWCPSAPPGWRALTVFHDTAQRGDRVHVGDRWVPVADLRAVAGRRDDVVLILATGEVLPLSAGGRGVTALRPVAQTDRPG